MKTILAMLAGGWLAAGATANATSVGYMPPEPTFVRGQARFQVLAPALVRLEYSPSGSFVDASSVAVINRTNWPGAAAQTGDKDGWFTLSTDKLSLRYKLGSGPFTTNNLQLTWHDSAGTHEWKPGDADSQNLGGVPASLDNRSTKTVTDLGPLSRKGCYLLDDSKTALFDAASGWVKARPAPDAQDWYFLAYGTDYKSALAQLAKLVGPPPMLPRYVFGSWFGSRAGYSGQEWEMIVKQFRDEQLPLDMVVIDSDSKTKMVWTGYDWDLEQMPDPAAFFTWMHQHGIKVTVNEHYGALTRDSDSHFEMIRQAMGLPADTKEIPHDLANKKYAGMFMNLLHKPDLDRGLAFWWQDGAAGANLPGLDPYLWTRHIEYEGSERITGRRTTAFCRLGTCWGSHRYGIFFTGDLHGVWESLPVLIPATVRGGNQLTPYMNNLCGGVFVVDLPPELYQRWVQFGAFSPVLWFHGLWGLRLPWEYGSEGVETYSKFAGLRYHLLPYIYTCSREAHDTGLPLVRGTYLEYPDQEGAYAFQQQYLFGKDLLVAPITEPGNGKPVKKDVYLPGGQDWYDYFTGDLYSGGKAITHQCPLDRMPLFVRAGSILPSAPPMAWSDQKRLDPLTLDVYAGEGAAEFNLYEDDGVSLDYRKGAYAWTPLRFDSWKPGNYALRIGPAQGTYQGQLEKRRYEVRIHGLLPPSTVVVNGGMVPAIEAGQDSPGCSWDSRQRVLTIRLTRPLPVGKETLVHIMDAGTFADAVTWQKAWNLREQLRQAKRDMKLKHASIVSGPGIKKPPRVIRVTEEVERQLTDLIDRPKGCAKAPPDFAALQQRVLAALTDDPFESNRSLPEFDPESRQGTELTKGAKFTPQELQTITNRFRGAALPAWSWPAIEAH
ncbi:MAG TPA: TIM-barrel domain-containing protein [Candidatus Acidoferrum sp.]|nr:TIM-barrel domain-containing protein [Candidatus Acidoferrum sp.]